MDPNGVLTNFTYDGRGRVVTIAVGVGSQSPTDPPATTIIAYGVAGEITKITEPNGAWVSATYDSALRLMSLVDAVGETVTYSRDAMGNATSIVTTRADGSSAFSKTQTFDELGRLIESVGSVPTNSDYKFAYDKTSNLTAIYDPLGNKFAFGFDALNRLIQETDEETASVNLTRNGIDAITAYQDPRSLTTSYVRNGFGEVIQETSPDRGTTVYLRDQRGLVTQRTDGRGIITTYTYDNAGRPQTVSYSGTGSASDVTFTWDEVLSGSYNIGRLTTIMDGSGTTKRTYDSKGRVSSEARTIGGAPALVTSYVRDRSGYVIEAVYPSGREIVWNRDAQGRVRELAMHANSSMPWTDVINPVTWNPLGPVRALGFANGLTGTFGTDTDYRISSVMVAPSSGSAIVNRSLAWVGDTLTSITDNVTSGNSETFGYSPTRRLTSASASATSSYGAYTWAYDSVGNRTSEMLTTGLGTTTTTYNYPTNSNKLTSLTQGSNTRSLDYDADGNITSDTKSGGPWAYSYDSEDRLAQATSNSTTVGTYTYDGLWRLAKRVVTSPSSETHYLQDLDGHIIAETDGSGNTTREYIWLDDMPVAVIDGVNTPSPTTYYVHTDHLMRPVVMTDGNGAIVWSAVYQPFGATQSITGSLVMNARFPGQWFQLETGLHYNWFRHYDPSLGRYVESDPMGLKGGSYSTYSYAVSNPLSNFDPLGLYCAAFGGMVSCSTPYGQIPPFPQPAGWPATLNGSTAEYHAYDIDVPLNGANSNCVMNGIVNNPTPGSPSPATPQGTLNNATPTVVQGLLDALDWTSSFGNDLGGYNNSPTYSYVVNVNGSPAVVNVTLPGHPLFPGYVLRTINGSQVVNYGEGAGFLQGPLSRALGIAGEINGVWNGQTSGIMQKCGCQSN